MPDTETQSCPDLSEAEVLTLAETAAFLRVPEETVLASIAKEALPAQQIGGEWRFLKRAVVEWLRFGPRSYRELKMFPPSWILEHPFYEDLFRGLEKRIL